MLAPHSIRTRRFWSWGDYHLSDQGQSNFKLDDGIVV
jgi:hypothetical protein